MSADMPSYGIQFDRMGRVLARCPDCHVIHKSEETWTQLREQARREIMAELRREGVRPDMGLLPHLERLPSGRYAKRGTM